MSSLNTKINNDKENNLWKVDLIGEVDIYTANDLKNKLRESIEEIPQDIEINMKNLDYIDSTGLGILIGILKRLKQKDKDIYIINTKPNVRKIFTITGLDKIFKLEG